MKFLKSVVTFMFIISFIFVSAQERRSSIIADNAKVEQAGSGFAFTEGPAVASDGRVYFTDQPNDKIYLWDEKKGVISNFVSSHFGN